MIDNETERLNDLVDHWHAGEGEGQTLHEFLGMTDEEFRAWGRDERDIPSRGTVTT